jgi:hypothetical protein
LWAERSDSHRFASPTKVPNPDPVDEYLRERNPELPAKDRSLPCLRALFPFFEVLKTGFLTQSTAYFYKGPRTSQKPLRFAGKDSSKPAQRPGLSEIA